MVRGQALVRMLSFILRTMECHGLDVHWAVLVYFKCRIQSECGECLPGVMKSLDKLTCDVCSSSDEFGNLGVWQWSRHLVVII